MTTKQDLNNEIIKNQNGIDSALMLQIATSDDSQALSEELMSHDIPTQLRVFMLLKARNELLRIIRVSETLQKLEDTFMERALSDKDGMDVKSLSKAIETASESLQRSTDFVSSVMNDKELKLVVEQTNNTYVDNRVQNNYTAIQLNQESREKIRQVASRLLSDIDKNPSKVVNLEPVSDEDVIIEAIEESVNPDLSEEPSDGVQ